MLRIILKKATVLFFPCFIQLSCLHPKVFADKTVISEVGTDALLPCSYPDTPVSNAKIYWQTASGKPVHYFIEGKDNLNKQEPEYNGRTRLFPSELQKGNFSLELKHLTKSDQGVYVCINVPISQKQYIELIVKDVEKKTTPQGNSTKEVRDGNGSSQIKVEVPLLILLVLFPVVLQESM
ncbi:CD276 antigen-like [Erpetoichthys calabaricus]|uniref:CD276 antigen-like n=1 Tax=Erpetoichthys calabaricus TaxID=27687 RepID=A0A8C4TBU9_ERPCA|nr:CD276 antigen-like [Erpetoichthys calabaricus]XP_051781991.1 CD276 antigen-like [Erpetoichthys calabaricus]